MPHQRGEKSRCSRPNIVNAWNRAPNWQLTIMPNTNIRSASLAGSIFSTDVSLLVEVAMLQIGDSTGTRSRVLARG